MVGTIDVFAYVLMLLTQTGISRSHLLAGVYDLRRNRTHPNQVVTDVRIAQDMSEYRQRILQMIFISLHASAKYFLSLTPETSVVFTAAYIPVKLVITEHPSCCVQFISIFPSNIQGLSLYCNHS